MKICTKCKQEKDESEFYKDSSRKSGLDSHCKSCDSAQNKIYRHDKKEYLEQKHLERINIDPEKTRLKYREYYYYKKAKYKATETPEEIASRAARLNERARKNNRKLRFDVISHYGGKCQCCGEIADEFLCIDHINGGGNKHRKELKSKGGVSFYRYLRKNNYPDGYRVLCHNCNHALGSYGYCPHKSKVVTP